MKKIAIICCALFALTLPAWADRLTVPNTEIVAGTTFSLPVSLENSSDKLTAWEFQLTLPEGVTLVKDDEGYFRATLSDRHDAESHTLTVGRRSDGSYRFVCYSSVNAPLTGTEGVLVTLTLQADASVKGKELEGRLSAISFSETGSKKTTMDDVVFQLDATFPTITLYKGTRAYGDANPELTYTVAGAALRGIPAISCAATQASPVGTYAVTAERGTIENLYYEVVDGTLTVTPAPLTITANSFTRKQGVENPEFTISYDGFKNEETAEVLATQPTIACAATAASEPGTYPITVSGAEAANYAITYVNGTLTVVAADAVVVTATSYSIEYGEALPEFAFTSEGAELVGTPVITCAATASSPVGTYPIVITKGGVTNYNDTYVNGTLTITKAPLTISVGDYSRNEGEENPTFTVSYSGFKNDETADVLTTLPSVTCAAVAGSEAGTYPIVVSGAAAQNYAITYVNGILTVNAVEGVVVTGTSYSIEYGDALPEFAYTTAGAELVGTPVFTCAATSSSPVGTYPIVVTQGSVSNYKASFVNGTLTITKAPLTITANDATRKQGEENPEFTVTYSGFKNDETAEVLTSQPTATCEANANSEPGTYSITVNGAEAQNYSISYVNGTLTVVAADGVVVTANSFSIEYGDALPEFNYTSSGAELVGTPAITCEATSASPVGTYPIVIAKGGVTNYNDTYVNGTLTITKAPLTITANDAIRNEGEENPTFTVSYSGFKNGETAEVLTTQPTIACAANAESEPGTYPITVSGAEAQNYEISYVNGTLTVDEPEIHTYSLTITANGNGTVNCGDAEVREDTQIIDVNEGEGVSLTITPDDGYEIFFVQVNGEYRSLPKGRNILTLEAISAQTTVVVRFRQIPVEEDSLIPLITDVTQLSSPWTEPSEGSLVALLDGDPATFWHSIWTEGSVPNHSHYLQVELPEGEYPLIYMRVTRRRISTDHITQWGIYGSNDSEAEDDKWEHIAELETPYVEYGETIMSEPFDPQGYKYLRFWIDGTTSNRGYAHMSEFQLLALTSITPVASITLSEITLTMAGGERHQLTATVLPEDAIRKTLRWTSENASIAKVSSTGLVTALKQGSTTITATAMDGSGVSASCMVTVTSDVPNTLPDVPFEFFFRASDYDETTHSILNHIQANLSDYSLQLSANIPAFDGEKLTMSARCEGFIDKWENGSNESGAYFYRQATDNMTIIAKVAPQAQASSDFVANRGNDYNYMWRIGEHDHMFLHTRDAYDSSRSLTLPMDEVSTLAVRVNGAEDYILLQNLTTGDELRVNGINWGGSDNVFKLFYNDGGEYYLGDFYWVYYSFEYLSDIDLATVASVAEIGTNLISGVYTDAQGITYTLDAAAKTAVITGHATDLQTDIILPPTVRGCTVTGIQSGAFADVTELNKITYDVATPFVIPDDAFSASVYANTHLFVPYGAVETYQNTDGWKLFENIEFILPDSYTDDQGIVYRINEERTEYHVTDYEGENGASITIPGKLFNVPVVTIYEHVFMNKGLKSVVFSEGLQSIGGNAFHGCKMKELILPSTVTYFYSTYNPFSSCDELETIRVADGNPVYDSREDCNAILNTKNNTIVVGGKKTTFPASVTGIERDAFYGSAYTDFVIPEGITWVSELAFSGCVNLQSITLPSTLTRIANRAWDEGTPLTGTITSYIEKPFPVNCFTDETYQNATLYIPTGARDLYTATEGWQNFQHIEEFEPETRPIILYVQGEGTVLVADRNVSEGTSNISVENGSDVTLTFTPSEGYILKTLIVDAEDRTADVVNNQLTLTNYRQQKNVCVVFQPVGYSSTNILPWGTEVPWIAKYQFQALGTEAPANDANDKAWMEVGYDDSQWLSLVGPMANATNFVSHYNYHWEGEENCFYLRRHFTISEILLGRYFMELLHDDGAIVYLNGQQVAQTPSLSQAGQETYEIPTEAFVVGDNLLAIYVQENAGDQYLDYRLWTDYKKPVASVSLNESEIEIEGGERFTLTATIEPTDAGNKEVRWASADEEIASVTNTGVVFGRKQGTTTIIAYSVENEDIQATCTVTVTSDGPLSPYTDEQGITYRLTDDDTAYMVTSYSSEVEDADLVIPDVLFNIPVTQINSYSFYNDKNLRSLVLSEGIVYVGHNAFHGCSHLKELHIPSTLINLYDGDSPLSSCPNLEVITVAEGNPRYDSREDCNAIIDTESNTMIVGCKGTTFPASVHAIGSDAFYGSSFTEMILPEGITTLGNIAFGGCFQLANITIPSTMTSISNGAFNEGTPLTGTITSYVTEPFPVSCFTDETYEKATLRVPFGTAELYASTEGWQNFQNVKEFGTDEHPRILVQSFTREYGEENPELTCTIEGNLTTQPVLVTTADATSPVGTYEITVQEGTEGNAQVVNGTLTITKAPLAISVGSYTRMVGDQNPEFEIVYDGFKNGETADVLTTQPTATCEATVSSPEGEYAIVVNGAAAQNYEITYSNGTLTVIPASGAVLIADNFTIAYGDPLPTFTYTSHGEAFEGQLELVCEADVLSVGTYSIVLADPSVLGSHDTFIPGFLTITHAPLVIGVGNYETVYGDEMPEFKFTYEGFRNGETADVLTSQPEVSCEGVHVGRYPIVVSGAEAENYTIDYEPGVLTINPATLTVSVGEYTRDEGQPNPEFTLSFKGWKYEDDESVLTSKPIVTCLATEKSPAGSYPITISGGEAQDYLFNYVKGSLIVGRVEYTLTLETNGNGSVSYGDVASSGEPTTTQVHMGDKISITFTPDAGYKLGKVTVDDEDVTAQVENGRLSLTMDEAKAVQVTFEEIMHNVQLVVTGFGTVICNDQSAVGVLTTVIVGEAHGANIDIRPDVGYQLQSIQVNNEEKEVTIDEDGMIHLHLDVKADGMVISVIFGKVTTIAFTQSGVHFQVPDETKKELAIVSSTIQYEGHVVIPSSVSYLGETWAVTSISDGAFANSTGLLCIDIPASIQTVGTNIFKGCNHLAAIIWRSSVGLTNDEEEAKKTLVNPNLLFYTNDTGHVPSCVKNVVHLANLTAESITLSDTPTAGDFYCPMSFKAQTIEYSHSYEMQTGRNGECKGWETIALPFTVQNVHQENKDEELIPFCNVEETDVVNGTKPFWLYAFGGSSGAWGFHETSTIEAGVPYLISIPNNTGYDIAFQLGGKVRFSSENVDVIATVELEGVTSGSRTFHPCFLAESTGMSVLTLNVENTCVKNSLGVDAGSEFHSNLREARPFEAYFTTTSGVKSFGVFDTLSDGIQNLPMLPMQSIASDLYDLGGRKVQQTGKGIYIKDGRKYVVK